MNQRPDVTRDDGISEILGTLFLITIAVVIFSVISFIVLNPWIFYSDESPPPVTLATFVQGDTVVIEHRGGIPLNSNTKITITVAGTQDSFTAGGSGYLTDENGNGEWDIGERIIYPAGNLQGKLVSCLVVDTQRNCIVLNKKVQSGTTETIPYVTALEPTDVTETSGTLKMYYNFLESKYLSGAGINFTFGPSGGPYVKSAVVTPLSLEGIYGFPLVGLQNGTLYEFWACINSSEGEACDGPMCFYTYQKMRGLWPFDEPAGSLQAEDMINPRCNGTVHGAVFVSEGKKNGSLKFQDESDYIEVPHHQKFNITDEMSIGLWVNVSSVGAEFPGRITEISTENVSEIISTSCAEPDLIKISGTLYAVVYHDVASAYITTFEMTDDGAILGVIDTKPILVPHFFEPGIIQVHNDVYALIFGASDDQVEAKNHLVTLPIYGNGIIGDVIDSYDFPIYYGREATLVHIASTVYGICAGGSSYQMLPTGYLATFTIDDSGSIGHSIIDSLKFAPPYCSEASLVYVTNETYAIAYNGCGPDIGMGYITTLKVFSNGSLGPLEDTFQFGVTDGLEPMLIRISDELLAVAYGADSDHHQRPGSVHTILVDSQGTIVNGSFDSIQLPVDYCSEMDFFPVYGDVFAVSFSGGNSSNWNRGFLSTLSISNTGNISDSVLSLYTFENSTALCSTATAIISYLDRFIVFYGTTNVTGSGFLSLVKIDLTGGPKWVFHKGTAYAMKVNYNLIVASMTIGNITYTVTGTIPLDNWTKVDLTYGMGFLTLYVNDVIQTGSSVPCSGEIEVNSEPLVFGEGIDGFVDEIQMYHGVYVPT